MNADPLDVARALVAAGVPVFVAPPDESASTGYRLPSAWQQTPADPALLDAWRPGMALGMVGGQGVDVVDIDPRHGGEVASLNGTMPKVYGVASTPSGGAHHFVASLGVAKTTGVLPGVDIQAGAPDGTGRGFAFLAPTVRRSKVTGEPAPYAWTEPLDVAGAAAGDDTGAALAAMVCSARSGNGTRAKVPGGPAWWQEFNAPAPQRASAADAAIDRHLAAVTTWTPGSGKGFRDTLGAAAMTLGGYVGAPGHSLDAADATERLEDAAGEAWGTADDDDRRWIADGLRDGIKRPFHVVPDDQVAAHQAGPGATTSAHDTNAFWQARPELERVREWARARLVSPWALLGCVLTRVVCHLPCHVVLPALRADIASLNLFVALVGAPGQASKSSGIKVSARCLQPVVEWPYTQVKLGSGQGIAHTYGEWVSPRKLPDGSYSVGKVHRTETRALFVVNEIDHLAGNAAMSGSIVLPELRSLYMGEQLGGMYVERKKRVLIDDHTYRAGLLTGVQAARAGVLLDDVDGGLPQRFVWARGAYPHADAAAVADPDPIVWRPHDALRAVPGHTGVIELGVYADIVAEVRAQALRDARGEGDPLDGHRLLAKLKVAAALDVLHGHAEVTEGGWQLADVIMAESDAGRQVVVDEQARMREARVTASGRAKAVEATIVADADEARVRERTRERVLSVLDRPGDEAVGGEIWRALSRPQREWRDAVLDELISTGVIEIVPSESGDRYRRT